MGLAYEMVLIALRLSDRGDIANDVVAHKIIEHAKGGERDPEQLCEAVLQAWRSCQPARRAGHRFWASVVELGQLTQSSCASASQPVAVVGVYGYSSSSARACYVSNSEPRPVG